MGDGVGRLLIRHMRIRDDCGRPKRYQWLRFMPSDCSDLPLTFLDQLAEQPRRSAVLNIYVGHIELKPFRRFKNSKGLRYGPATWPTVPRSGRTGQRALCRFSPHCCRTTGLTGTARTMTEGLKRVNAGGVSRTRLPERAGLARNARIGHACPRTPLTEPRQLAHLAHASLATAAHLRNAFVLTLPFVLEWTRVLRKDAPAV